MVPAASIPPPAAFLAAVSTAGRHAQVEHHHIGNEFVGESHGCLSVRCLADDDDIGLAGEESHDHVSERIVIIDDNHGYPLGYWVHIGPSPKRFLVTPTVPGP